MDLSNNQANCASESFGEIDHMLKNLTNELDSILLSSSSILDGSQVTRKLQPQQ